jgi:hypothetical protein
MRQAGLILPLFLINAALYFSYRTIALFLSMVAFAGCDLDHPLAGHPAE